MVRHVLWSYETASDKVHHLSHFGPIGQGINARGAGELDALGNLTLTLHFEDLPSGHYRVYEYLWLSNKSYRIHAKEFGVGGVDTGRGYMVTYVRQ